MCRCILGWRSVTYHFQVTVTLTTDFFLIIVSEAYLSYHLRYNPQIWCVHAYLDENCNVPFLGYCDLHLWPSLKNWHWAWCISPIFFEVGITHLVCESIFGWWYVMYQLWVTVTLTSELVFRIIMSGAYLLYYLRYESQIWCLGAYLYGGVSCTIYGLLWPWPWL